MDQTKQKIISAFREKGSELSTREIAALVYEEYKSIKPKDAESKRQIAQFHRKLLHHINLLIRDGILRVNKHGEKGHKFFVLDIGDEEEISEITPKYKKRVVISKPAIPVMPIEGYEKQSIIVKYEPGTWIDRLNSLIIRCDKLPDLSDLTTATNKSFSVVNDSICLEGFDKVVNSLDNKLIKNVMEKLNSEAEDYGKIVNCIIDIENINNKKLLEILEYLIEPKIKNIVLIFDLDGSVIQEHFGALSEIISLYIRKKRKFYLKNKRIQRSPYFLGKAGPYCFLEKEWNAIKDKDYSIIACSQSSLIVDVEKFHSIYGLNIDKFSQLMLNVSKSFLSANSMQRRKSEDYFKEVIKLFNPIENEFLELSRNYIRFWNYGITQPGVDQDLVLNMMSEAKKKINEFSAAEETIYKSCGMPTRFKIALSCASSDCEEKLSPAKFRKFVINDLEDLYNKKTKTDIINREQVLELFDGGNDITFHRAGEVSPEDVLREISVLMNTYKFPFFSYAFENIKGNMNLITYLGDN